MKSAIALMYFDDSWLKMQGVRPTVMLFLACHAEERSIFGWLFKTTIARRNTDRNIPYKAVQRPFLRQGDKQECLRLSALTIRE
jgi:hypothetical protein